MSQTNVSDLLPQHFWPKFQLCSQLLCFWPNLWCSHTLEKNYSDFVPISSYLLEIFSGLFGILQIFKFLQLVQYFVMFFQLFLISSIIPVWRILDVEFIFFPQEPVQLILLYEDFLRSAMPLKMFEKKPFKHKIIFSKWRPTQIVFCHRFKK